MPGTDSYQQGLPYPKLGDAPNAESALSSLVNSVAPRANMRFTDTAALNAAITTPVAGMEAWLTAEKRKVVYDGATWQTYVPQGQWITWTPAWNFANGSLGTSVSAGRYRRTGTTIELEAKITCGLSSSLGDGLVSFTLPVPAQDSADLMQYRQGQGRHVDGTGSAWHTLIAVVERGGLTANVFAYRLWDMGWVVPGGAGTGQGGSGSLAWAPGGSLRIQLAYEALS